MNEPLRLMLRSIASLRLTVWLLALAIFLVFAGTLAQVDMGIWATLNTYFRSFLVWIPLQVFLPRSWDVAGVLPFPGGYVVGGALAINLLAAHALRFRWQRGRVGLLLAHLGLVLLIVGELVTALLADEGHMTIDEGQTVDYTEDLREVELAIIDPQDPIADHVVAVPQRLIEKGGLIQDEALPFALQIDAWYPNAQIVERHAGRTRGPVADRGTAVLFDVDAVERPPASGVERNGRDVPAAFVSVFDGTARVGTWMTSLYFSLIAEPRLEEVHIGDRVYYMALQFKRTYKPYSIQLLDFQHDRYVGTNMPRNFSSRVRLVDPVHNEDREALIYMNHPLRYRGETFYQASYKAGDTGTVLQVVRNPGWLIPYIACALGALGMLMHFGISLTRFLREGTLRRGGKPVGRETRTQRRREPVVAS
jgi:hypothetical protein